LAQASLALEQAPMATLDAQQLAALTPEEHLIATTQAFNSVLEADQAELPAADQTGLADVDLGLLQADKGLLDAAEGFLAADQAGDLTSFASALPTNLATFDADFGWVGAAINVAGAEFGAEFFNAIGVPDIFLP
jgi:flagellar hook-length control protein FliK